jgi:hypothetical protein
MRKEEAPTHNLVQGINVTGPQDGFVERLIVLKLEQYRYVLTLFLLLLPWRFGPFSAHGLSNLLPPTNSIYIL